MGFTGDVSRTSNARIAIWGATGAIGRSLSDALRVAGHSYRVVGRSQASLQREFGSDPLAELVTWNPDDPASIQTAAAGIETIVYVVGVPYWQFALHPKLMRATIDGAVAAGVKQIVLITNVYPYGLPQTTPVHENHPRNPQTFKGRMRKEQEDLLLAADREGRLQGTVLRLPDFYGPAVETSLLSGVFAAAASGKSAQILGPIDTPHEFIFVPDVGPVVLRLAGEPRAHGRWWHLAGSGVTTQRAMLEKIYALAGVQPKFFVVQNWMLRIFGVFSPLMRELVEMHYLQTNPVLLDDSAIHELLGPIQKTSYDEGVQRILDVTRVAAPDQRSLTAR